MSDFASATMMRLIRLGMMRQGLAIVGDLVPTGAHVPFAAKRTLADRLLEEHGPIALLRVGEAIEDVPDEPATIAIALARDPDDLLSRWQRLERFVHSRHRTRIDRRSDRSMTLCHLALAPHPPPSAAEDLLVFGLLFALLRHCAVDGLKAKPAGHPEWVCCDGQWPADLPAGDFSTWTVTWRRTRALPRPLAEPVGDWLDQARAFLETDPGRSWSVAELARQIRASPRSLQRHLKGRQTSFSHLLVTARLTAASRFLTTSGTGLAEIGYACGFADQAHFTRQFRRYMGTTPWHYRNQFADTFEQ